MKRRGGVYLIVVTVWVCFVALVHMGWRGITLDVWDGVFLAATLATVAFSALAVGYMYGVVEGRRRESREWQVAWAEQVVRRLDDLMGRWQSLVRRLVHRPPDETLH